MFAFLEPLNVPNRGTSSLREARLSGMVKSHWPFDLGPRARQRLAFPRVEGKGHLELVQDARSGCGQFVGCVVKRECAKISYEELICRVGFGSLLAPEKHSMRAQALLIKPAAS